MTFKKLALTTILAGGVALPALAQGLGGADAGVGGQVGTDGGSVGADVGADVGVGDTGADVGVSADVGTDGASASADADASASAETGDSDASGSADADDGSGDTDSADAGSDSSDTGSAADSDSADTGADADDGAATASATAGTGASGQGNTEMSQELKLLLDRPTGVVSSDGVLIGTIYNTRTDPADGSTQAVVEVNGQTGLSPDSLAIEVANLTVQADGTLGFDMTIDSLRDRLEAD